MEQQQQQTRTVRDHPPPQLLLTQSAQRVARPADLEGADLLEVLAFEEEVDLRSGGRVAAIPGCAGEGFGGLRGGNDGVEGGGGEDRSAVDVGFDAVVGGGDGGAGEREGAGGVCHGECESLVICSRTKVRIILCLARAPIFGRTSPINFWAL